jgi:hypothetical protein
MQSFLFWGLPAQSEVRKVGRGESPLTKGARCRPSCSGRSPTRCSAPARNPRDDRRSRSGRRWCAGRKSESSLPLARAPRDKGHTRTDGLGFAETQQRLQPVSRWFARAALDSTDWISCACCPAVPEILARFCWHVSGPQQAYQMLPIQSKESSLKETIRAGQRGAAELNVRPSRGAPLQSGQARGRSLCDRYRVRSRMRLSPLSWL